MWMEPSAASNVALSGILIHGKQRGSLLCDVVDDNRWSRIILDVSLVDSLRGVDAAGDNVIAVSA
jgi:hypothetical protein